MLLRVDFNEPLDVGGRKKIKDSFRIRATAPTIKDLVKRGARVVLAAHLEDSVTKKQLSFKPHVAEIARITGLPAAFIKNYSQSNISKAFVKSKIVLLENVRFQKGETSNDPHFARRLASLADLYINEAFSVSHRNHASIVGVPQILPSYAGPLFQKEVRALSEVLHPPRPFLFILGGAKFSTKIALLKNFLQKANAVFIGGALANTFLLAHGIDVGNSLVEKKALEDVKKHFLRSKKILLPFDAWVARKRAKNISDIEPSEKICDVGPKTTALLSSLAKDAKYVLWNGPLGFIEGGYDQSTRELLKNLARLKRTKVTLGGGDTMDVLDAMRLHQHFYHISTGGGAMLDFLADGSLPGIEALRTAQKRMAR